MSQSLGSISGQSGFDALGEVPTVGRPKIVSADYLDRLRELVSHSPRQFGYPFERWTAHWLSRHLGQEFDCIVSDRHINRLLKQMGLSTRHKKERAAMITIADLPGRDRA